MHLKSPTLLVFVIVLSLLFISGCEKNPTTPAIEGEPEDSGYETMDDLNGISLDVMKIAFDLTDTVMAMGGSSPPLLRHIKSAPRFSIFVALNISTVTSGIYFHSRLLWLFPKKGRLTVCRYPELTR